MSWSLNKLLKLIIERNKNKRALTFSRSKLHSILTKKEHYDFYFQKRQDALKYNPQKPTFFKRATKLKFTSIAND